MSQSSPPQLRVSSSRSVVLTCLAVAIVDGVDLLVFGSVLPVLLETQQWGLTAASAGLIGSLSLIGMMLGGTFVGYVTDIIGRRPVVLACVSSFSVFTALCAVAPNLEIFGLLRFVAGIGFGGALPTVLALTMEYVKIERRQFYNGVIQTGFPIGGSLIAIIAIWAIPAFGWQFLFLLGGALGVVLFLVALRYLPESMAFLASRGRTEEARRLAERYAVDMRAESGIALQQASGTDSGRTKVSKLLLAPGFRVATILFPMISFCGLLVAYGMNTWIPQILRSQGYDLGSALSFLLAFNIGSGIGMLVITGLADRFRPRPVISIGFVLGAVAVTTLTLQPAQAVAFALVLLIGFCASSQPGVYGFVGVYYPPAARGTALGLSVGLGRLGGVAGPLMTGLIMGSSLSVDWAFYAFATVGVVAALLVLIVPRTGQNDQFLAAAAPRAQQASA